MTAILPGSGRASAEGVTALLHSNSSSNQSQAAFVWDHRSGGIRQRKSFEYRHQSGGGGGNTATAAAAPPSRSSVSRMGPDAAPLAASSHQSVVSGILAPTPDRSSAPTGNRLVLDDAGYGKTEPSSSSGVFLEVAAAAAVGGLPEETDRGRALIGEHVTAGGYQLNPSTNDSPLPSRMHKASLDAERPPPPTGSSNNRGAPDRARNKTFCSSLTPRCVWGRRIGLDVMAAWHHLPGSALVLHCQKAERPH